MQLLAASRKFVPRRETDFSNQNKAHTLDGHFPATGRRLLRNSTTFHVENWKYLGEFISEVVAPTSPFESRRL
jgi:hypothetical protein